VTPAGGALPATGWGLPVAAGALVLPMLALPLLLVRRRRA